MVAFILRFLGLVLVSVLLYNLSIVTTTLVESWNHLLAQAAFWPLQRLDDDLYLSGKVIGTLSGSHAVSVESDCNGIEATLLLLCAILAFPASWRARLLGVSLGLLVIQGINLVRIISLVYLSQWDGDIFKWTHEYLWPGLLILVALGIFGWWMRALGEA
jgi:exosortase H (IPTLxxWG-CTERM-specific)